MDKGNAWEMYQLDFSFSGIIFIPYAYQFHWSLLVLDVDQSTIMHLDPFDKDDGNRAIQGFLRYITDCKLSDVRKPNNLCKKRWKVISFTEKRPVQKDGNNCGIFVMKFMDLVAKKKSLNIKFDPIAYRKEVAEMLINYSEDIYDICFYCEKKKNSTNNFTCHYCKRWAHEKCVFKISHNIKEEDPLIRYNTCHLCCVNSSKKR